MRDTFDLFAPKDRGRFGELEQQHRPGRGPKVTGASDIADFALQLRHEKPAAIAVTDPARPHLNGGKWIWLPKSQIEYVLQGAVCVVSVPYWLAKDKELL